MARTRRRLGIRARVVASFLVLLVSAEVVSIVVLHQVGTSRIDDQADRDLMVAVDDLRGRLDALPVPVGTPGGPALTTVFDDYLGARPGRGDQAYLAFVSDQPYAASSGAPTALADLPEVGGWSTTAETTSGQASTPAGAVRWLAVPVLAGDRVAGVLVATEFLSRQQDALTGTITTVSVVTALVLAGACLLAWGVAGRALAPLHALAGAARSVSTGHDLSTRVAVDSRDEVGVVSAALNEMLDRLQLAFDSQQQFLDDAGHELRTPITIVRGHLELLDDDPEQRAADVALVLDELDRMDRLVRDLRVLARSGRPDFLESEDLDVGELVEGVGRKAAAMADRDWHVSAPEASVMRGDRHRLTEAMLNLVDNAIDATRPGVVIEIGATTTRDAVELWVRDEGRGLDPEDATRLFERGGAVTRRPGGTGLGLPIVAGIAAAHGGTVAADGRPGQGTCVRMRLPVGAAGPG
jgi:two-component system OmpR family sensor kinase